LNHALSFEITLLESPAAFEFKGTQIITGNGTTVSATSRQIGTRQLGRFLICQRNNGKPLKGEKNAKTCKGKGRDLNLPHNPAG